jgi:hypothetical protein
MKIKKRGRPQGPTGMRRLQLLQPPDHIKARIISRAGKPVQQWIDVLQNMDEYQKLIIAYRRKFRITEADALVLIVSFNETVKKCAFDDALSRVKSWKKVSEAGLRARGYEIPKWHEVARKLMAAEHARSSDRQVARLVQEREKRENRIPPNERSIRRFFMTLKK